MFGNGWVLGCHHSSIHSSGNLPPTAMSLKIAKLRIKPFQTHRRFKGLNVCPKMKNLVRTVKLGYYKDVKGEKTEAYLKNPPI